MAYFQPYVDIYGIHIPTYTDIRDELIAQSKTIFGSDIYIEADSQDYQLISIFADKIYDAMQSAVLAYNNRSPVTASGIGLDTLVAINGLTRQPATYSTAVITIVGSPSTAITNGVVYDLNNIKWSLPATITIPGAGTIDVTATCQTIGSIAANANDINKIFTPTLGWTSANNASAATVGTVIESDSFLRARQAISTAQPSLSRLEGTIGAIAAVSGVTRLKVYENDTGSTDSNGILAHSISCVVEGGTDLAVATAIFNNKGIGGGTVGTTTQAVVDSYGVSTNIKFTRPTNKDIDVVMTVKALAGYTTDITTLIKANIAAYLSSLEIGADVSVSSLWGIALSSMPDLKSPLFSITALTACLHSGSPGTSDIVIAHNEVARGNVSYITITVV
jgi:uncharacterized phage protein gp47/JayE